MKTYAIVEPRHTGHHLNYVGQLARAATRAGAHVVMFTTPEAAASQEFSRFVGDAAGQVVIGPTAPGPTTVQQAVGPAVIVYPDGDHQLISILKQLPGLERSTHVEVLLMRTEALLGGSAGRALRQLVKRATVRAVSAHPQIRVRWLTDSFGVVTSRPGYRAVAPIADPPTVDTLAAPVRPVELGPARDARPRIVLTGVITERKNPRLLVAAAARSGWQVVLAGRVDGDLATDVSLPDDDDAVVVINRHLLDGELVWLLQDADAAFVGYQTDAPSGILTAAIQLGTPAVALEGTWPGVVVQQLRAGATCAPTVPAVADALSRITTTTTTTCAPAIEPDGFARALLGLDQARTTRPMVSVQ